MSFSYKGKILISTPDISGDLFSRSVVLITEHNSLGTFGLILNKKNELASKQVQQLYGYDVDVYDGGPVESGRMIYIIKGKPETANYYLINDEYYITEDSEFVVSAVVSGRLPLENIKVFSGYSGWASKQLEAEISRKAWTVVDIYNLDFTSPNDQNLWKNIMQNLGGEYLLWANAPADVSLN